MKTKRERNKQLEFLQAYTNPVKITNLKKLANKMINQFKQTKFACENYSMQEQNASQQTNLMMQANFAEVEIKAIAQTIKDGDWPLTVIIIKTTGSGSSYSADCPNCGKTKILSSELNTMTAVCDKCYTSFKLEN